MFLYKNIHELVHFEWTDIDRALALELCLGIIRFIKVPDLKAASGAYFATDHSDYENAFHVLWKMGLAFGFRDKRDENASSRCQSIPFNERLDYKTYGKKFSPLTYFLLSDEEIKQRLLVTKEFQEIPIIELMLVAINLISGWGRGADDCLPDTTEKFAPPQNFVRLMELCVAKGFADCNEDIYHWSPKLWDAVNFFNGMDAK